MWDINLKDKTSLMLKSYTTTKVFINKFPEFKLNFTFAFPLNFALGQGKFRKWLNGLTLERECILIAIFMAYNKSL